MQGTLAKTLRVIRAREGLTLRQAAKKLRVTPGTLSELERGLRHPHDVTLSRIAKGYGVPVEKLFDLEGETLEEPVPLDKAPVEAEAERDLIRKAPITRDMRREAIVDRHIKTLYDWAANAEYDLKSKDLDLKKIILLDASISDSVRYHWYLGYTKLRELCSPSQLETLERGEARLMAAHKAVREAFRQRIEIEKLNAQFDPEERARLDSLAQDHEQGFADIDEMAFAVEDSAN